MMIHPERAKSKNPSPVQNVAEILSRSTVQYNVSERTLAVPSTQCRPRRPAASLWLLIEFENTFKEGRQFFYPVS